MVNSQTTFCGLLYLYKCILIRWYELHRNFQNNYAKSPEDYQLFDKQLLKLASLTLKRQIHCIPFLKEDKPKVFGSEFQTSEALYIMHCNKIRDDSFYLSIFPLKNEVESNPAIASENWIKSFENCE